MDYTKLCPKCGGALVAISERTGGFSGTKAVAGAVVAGPVGVAAGALGKKLTTVQCQKCGYTMEISASKAQSAEAYGQIYGPLEELRRQIIQQSMSSPLDSAPNGLNSVKIKIHDSLQISLKASKMREKEREAIASELEQINSTEDERQPVQQEIDRLSSEKKAKEKQLKTLGLFKFSEKKEVQAAIEQLNAQMEPKVKELKEITDRLKILRTDLADKCLRLACDAVDEYCVEIYRPYAKQLIAGLGSEPLTCSEINAKLSSSLTALQINSMLKDNPFITTTKKVKADKKEYSAYYLG